MILLYDEQSIVVVVVGSDPRSKEVIRSGLHVAGAFGMQKEQARRLLTEFATKYGEGYVGGDLLGS